jgi:hypothetical protein
LKRFDEYCYAHNKCLCGSPLPACKTWTELIFICVILNKEK